MGDEITPKSLSGKDQAHSSVGLNQAQLVLPGTICVRVGVSILIRTSSLGCRRPIAFQRHFDEVTRLAGRVSKEKAQQPHMLPRELHLFHLLFHWLSKQPAWAHLSHFRWGVYGSSPEHPQEGSEVLVSTSIILVGKTQFSSCVLLTSTTVPRLF